MSIALRRLLTLVSGLLVAASLVAAPGQHYLMSNLTRSTTTYATFNPADKSADFTLSGGDLTATATSGNGLVRSTVGKSAGKWYWEYLVVSESTATAPRLGIATSGTPTSNWPGQDSTSWSYTGNGQAIHNNSAFGYSSTFITGDVIGVALDMDGGTLTFVKNGDSLGQAYSGITGTVYAAVGVASSGDISITAHFSASSLSYAPPSGYTAGLPN